MLGATEVRPQPVNEIILAEREMKAMAVIRRCAADYAREGQAAVISSMVGRFYEQPTMLEGRS